MSLGKIPASVTDNLTSSLLYPGDKKLTCWFKLHLTGVAENSFKYTVQFHARVPQYQPSIVQADPIPDLDLSKTKHGRINDCKNNNISNSIICFIVSKTLLP